MTNKRTSGSVGSAARIAPGDTITARELTTIQSERILLPAPGVLTHLQFRRYAELLQLARTPAAGHHFASCNA